MNERGWAWLRRFWRFFSGVSVRTKIMGIVLGLVLLLGAGVTVQVRATMTNTLGHELDQRGISIARDLAARSTDLILTNNLFALHELLRDTVGNNEDLRYAFVLDAEGRVLVHSFKQGVPPDLLTINPVRSDERYRLQILDTEEGLIHDVAVPIFAGRAGTARVGLSERRLQAQLTTTTYQLLLTTLLVSLIGVLGSFLLTWVLTRPVQALVAATRAVARGDLSQRAPHWFADEIGALSTSFNTMVDDLAQAHEQTESYNRRLLRRNRELAALNAVAQAVSGPLGLTEALERALEQVLSVVDSDAGWVCLLGEDGTCRTFAGVRGLCQPQASGDRSPCLDRCACRQALETGRPVLVQPLVTACPLRQAATPGGRPITGHVTVPLLVKERVVGLLNVAGHDARGFQPEDLDLLSAVGRQLGVAVENTRLWEEVRRKEALRGELLKKVITAQEEERRRIARELHDETGQALTSLLVGLKVLAGTKDLAQAHHLADELKGMVSQTLEAVHDLAVELRPSVLDDLGLVPALQRYVRAYAAHHHLAGDVQTVGLDGLRLPPEVETTLYRIVQEALTNVARHAQASRVSVLLERRGNAVVAIVEDDGQGFDVAAALASESERHRLGLYGMEERATLVGGRLTVESAPGQGTTMFVEVPVGGRP